MPRSRLAPEFRQKMVELAQSSVRKAYRWVALIAIVLNGASPLVAHAKPRANRADPVREICSTQANKSAGDYGGSGGLPNGTASHSDCALCSLAADRLPVLPADAPLASASRREAKPSRVTSLIAPRESQLYRPARSRAASSRKLGSSQEVTCLLLYVSARAT
jgi:hypothetical protein